MFFRSRLAMAGVTVLAGAVAGLAFASPAAASANVNANASADVSAATPSTPVSQSSAGEQVMPTTPTTEAAKRKKNPCVGGAALDAESGKWRATVSCDDWTAVLPGTYDTRQEALDNGEGWARGVNSKVMDGPGCDPPFVLC